MTTGFVLLVVWSAVTFYVQRILSPLVFIPNAVMGALKRRYPKAWGGFLKPKLFALHDCSWRLSDLFLP
jgi:hypothetical protein